MRDLAAMGDSDALRQWLSVLRMQTAQIAEKDDQIQELRARLEERDRMAELLAEAEGRSAEVPELKLQIAELDLRLEDARRDAAAARQEADQLDRILMYGRRMLLVRQTADHAAAPPPTEAARLIVPSLPVDGTRRGRLAQLPRRIYLTYKYRGISSVLFKSLIFPLRLTPLDRVLSLGPGPGSDAVAARRWYKHHGRPVTIVIPSYRDAQLVAQLVAKIRQTTDRDRVRITVADDASGPEHLAALDQIEGIDVVAGEQNAGFATNVNRGLRAADPQHDVILLNSDVVPMRDWLASLQYATTHSPKIGIVGAKLLYPDNRIQYAGTIRNPDAPQWFDHRYRFKPADWGPADIAGPTLAATGACMYIVRGMLDRVGLFDEQYGMGYEDVDYCLRAWQAGYEVLYAPSARLHHHESITRGTSVGERELKSQHVFWRRWGTFLDERPVLNDDGRLRVVYVVHDTKVFGGLRLVFEQLNGLTERGHDAELWTLGSEPNWFELRCPVRSFSDYDALVAALGPVPAIKVATWWETAAPVWRASVVNGFPVYLVQDIETSYYPEVPLRRHEVLNTYRPEFRFLTTSAWNQARLAELGLDATLISPGVDLGTFRPLPDVGRRERHAARPGTVTADQEHRTDACRLAASPASAAGAVSVRKRARTGKGAGHSLHHRAIRRRGERAAGPGHCVRPDLQARGLLLDGPRGDGGRLPGRLHGRGWQP